MAAAAEPDADDPPRSHLAVQRAADDVALETRLAEEREPLASCIVGSAAVSPVRGVGSDNFGW